MLNEFGLISRMISYIINNPENNNLQFVKELGIWILVIVILIIIAILVIEIHQLISSVSKLEKRRGDELETKNNKNTEAFDNLIKMAGFSYELNQDMFYYNMDVWQRDVGYCHLYDEAAAPLGMIIDCEPIYFEYEGEKWLIEFWKGQYDLVTGCEIGVYKAQAEDLDIEGIFNGTFYRCIDNKDRLNMSFTLIKNGKILFQRSAKHWWLTGFKLGEFSEPSDLTMLLKITLKDNIMSKAFVDALINVGYSKKEIKRKGNTISLNFYKPHSTQPHTRTEDTDDIIQRKNEWLCSKYNEIVGPYNNIEDKINAIAEEAPEIYEMLLNIGNFKELFKIFDKIRGYLS
ncbi:DUF4474 domain-containing protein [Clostridium sp. SHJSY1]|uniref:DUF4474 domain-containing protein n=1 Tax=Clostridium sp. SHJSY1 TaxID=2942483 RepID=UPI002875182C|nr:DUF4474 domain-containing protein [Clostridium sp. SHJSY1]MDS0525102.1 DUF4474 domain-containing protein [Clostridium sp. SHJSY1]